MTQLGLKLGMVGTSIVLFSAVLGLNEALFRSLEFAPGINWIYLPAGMRLLCTLLFGGAGALGLLIVSWIVCYLYYFPDDLLRAFFGGILAAAAPYVVYLLAVRVYGLESSLSNLTPRGLLACIVAYCLASPLLHHLWFWLYDGRDNMLGGLAVMIAGDLIGTLIVVYAAKGMLALLPRRTV